MAYTYGGEALTASAQDQLDPQAFWKRVASWQGLSPQQQTYAQQGSAATSWDPNLMTQFNAGGAAPAPSPGTTPRPDMSKVGGTIGPSPTAPVPFNDAVRTQVLDLMRQGQEPVTLESPELAPQVAAFNLAQKRGLDEARSAMAERLGAQGLGSSGAFDTGVQGLYEQGAENKASYAADLVGRQLEGRRARMMQALSMGAGILSQDQEDKLRRDLAAIDAEIRKLGLSTQRELGMADIGVRQYGIGSQERLGLGDLALRRLLGMGALDLNRQRLGFDVGQWESILNNYGYNSLF